jgi:hypothetical protein
MTPLRAAHGCTNPVIRALSSTVNKARKPSTEINVVAALMRHVVVAVLFKRLKMTQIDALTQCLILALTAPNDKKAQQASELAEKIAFGLSVDQVEACKFEALEFVGFE